MPSEIRRGRFRLAPRDAPLDRSRGRDRIGRILGRLREFAGRTLGRQAEPRRVKFQLAVDQPEVAVTVMQGFRMCWVAEPDYLDDVFQGEIDEADLAVRRLAQLGMIGLRGILHVVVQGRRDRDEIAFVIEPIVDHALSEEMFAPELLQRVGPEGGGVIGKEAARVREFGVARLQFRHGLTHAFGIFDFEGDEAVTAADIRITDQGVEGRVVARELRIAAAGGMLEEKLARGAGEGWQEFKEIARGAFERVPPGRQQIEGERHGREQVRRESARRFRDRQRRAGRYGRSRA